MAGRYALSRRGFLGAGAAGAVGAALGTRPPRAAAQPPKADGPNVLVIMLEGARSDFVSVYHDSDDLAKTPNIDDLSGQSLRFRHATPESMPSVPARRSFLTGMRSYPFRDWEATEGFPRIPGWSKIRDSQPRLLHTLQQGGVTTAYVTDNPYLIGPNFASIKNDLDVWSPLYGQAAYRNFNVPITAPASAAEANKYLLPKLRGTPAMDRMREYVAYNQQHRHSEADYSAARVFSEGMRQLEQLKGKSPFFMVVDAFEPTSPFDPPPAYRKGFKAKGVQNDGVDPIMPFHEPAGTLKHLDIDDDTVSAIRELYAGEMTFVDSWVGKLLDKLDSLKLADDTAVFLLSSSGMMLGEHGIVGVYPPAAHPEVYEVPFMIRDPQGRRGGDDTGYHAQSHDVPTTALGYLGLRAPGKMDGEDLTVMFDDDEDQRDPFPRPYYTFSLSDMIVVGNEDWELISDTVGTQKRVYHTEGDGDHLHEVGSIHPQKTRELFGKGVMAAGGTLPRFGPTSAVRPVEQDSDPTNDDDKNGSDVSGNGVIGNG